MLRCCACLLTRPVRYAERDMFGGPFRIPAMWRHALHTPFHCKRWGEVAKLSESEARQQCEEPRVPSLTHSCQGLGSFLSFPCLSQRQHMDWCGDFGLTKPCHRGGKGQRAGINCEKCIWTQRSGNKTVTHFSGCLIKAVKKVIYVCCKSGKICKRECIKSPIYPNIG